MTFRDKQEEETKKMKPSLTLMAVCVVFLAALGDIGNALAQQTTVEIYGHTHGGCRVGNQVYLPTYAGDRKTARFQLPAGRQQCHDMINRAQTSCEDATDFQSTNPQGRPWKSGEKHPGCLRIFRDEIPHCRDHYESQRHKCDQQASSGSGPSNECMDLLQRMIEYGGACGAGNASACDDRERMLDIYVDRCG